MPSTRSALMILHKSYADYESNPRKHGKTIGKHLAGQCCSSVADAQNTPFEQYTTLSVVLLHNKGKNLEYTGRPPKRNGNNGSLLAYVQANPFATWCYILIPSWVQASTRSL